jgi:hypothetical protein
MLGVVAIAAVFGNLGAVESIAPELPERFHVFAGVEFELGTGGEVGELEVPPVLPIIQMTYNLAIPHRMNLVPAAM